jgi:hypothetical protein
MKRAAPSALSSALGGDTPAPELNVSQIVAASSLHDEPLVLLAHPAARGVDAVVELRIDE